MEIYIAISIFCGIMILGVSFMLIFCYRKISSSGNTNNRGKIEFYNMAILNFILSEYISEE